MRQAVGLPADQSVHDIKWQAAGCSLLPLPNKTLPDYQIDAPNEGNDDHSQLTAIRTCKYCISLLFTLGDPVTTLAGFRDWGNVHHLDIDGGNNRCGSLELSCIPISAKPLLPNPSLHFL